MLLFVAKSVARIHTLQAHTSANIAGVNSVDFFALVGVHLQQTADPLARPFPEFITVTADFSTPEYTRM